MVLALDQQGVQRHPEPGPRSRWRGDAAAAGRLLGHAQGDAAEPARAIRPDIEKSRAEARKIMEKAGLRPGQAAQDQGRDAQHRDLSRSGGDPDRPAQDRSTSRASSSRSTPRSGTPRSSARTTQVGMNLTGVGIDDPDVNFYENYYSTSDRNYTALQEPRGRQADRPAVGRARPREAQEDGVGDREEAGRRRARGRSSATTSPTPAGRRR